MNPNAIVRRSAAKGPSGNGGPPSALVSAARIPNHATRITARPAEEVRPQGQEQIPIAREEVEGRRRDTGKRIDAGHAAASLAESETW